MPWRNSALCAVAAAALPALAAAGDLSALTLEDLLKVEVEGASRYAQPLAETPSTATVVTAEDIRRFGFRDLGEALQTARGVYVARDRTYSYLGVRGFGRPGDYNSRILLLQDGFRTNDPVYDQAMIGLESPIDLDWIKRLEFVPGPSSAAYGGNALFGIANAILWSGADLDGTRVAAEAGDGRLARISALSGRRTEGGLDWVAGLSVYGRRGDDLYFRELDRPGVGNGIVHHLDGERYVKGLLKGSWESWRASLGFASREKDVPTAYFGTLPDTPGNFTRDRQFHLDVTNVASLAADLDGQLRLHVGHYTYDADYPYAGVLNRDETRADWWSGEYQMIYSGWRDHRFLAGAEIKRGERLLQRNFDVAPPAPRLGVNGKSGSAGVYVQDEWRFAAGWLANLGLRTDHGSNAPTINSPRAALIYRPADEVTLKLLYGRAFRAANEYERRYNDGNLTQKANPDLKPERIVSRELALDVTPLPSLRLGLGRYAYTIRDLIDQVTDTDGLLVFRNQPEMNAAGWEAEAEALFGGGWRVRGNLSWQKVSQPQGEPTNSPRRLGKLLVDGPLPGVAWTLGANLQAVGPRRTLLGSVPGYVTTNLTLREAATKGRGAWSFGLYNATGKRYWDPGAREHPEDALPSDGLQWRLRWEIGF